MELLKCVIKMKKTPYIQPPQNSMQMSKFEGLKCGPKVWRHDVTMEPDANNVVDYSVRLL